MTLRQARKIIRNEVEASVSTDYRYTDNQIRVAARRVTRRAEEGQYELLLVWLGVSPR